MEYKILTQNGVDNTNIDGARDHYFNAGMRDGIVKGSLNEGNLIANGNSIGLDTCVLLIGGHPIVIKGAWVKQYTSFPSVNTRYAVVAQIVVDDNSNVAFDILDLPTSTTLRKDKLFKNANGAGTYQVEIGRFTLTTSGTIEDVVRKIDIITGGKGSGDGVINIGNVTTNTLAAGLEAEVDIEQRLNEEDGKTYTDFNFDIPAGATIDTIIAGTPTQSGGQTVTPITVTLTDGTTRTFNITVTNGQTGATGVGISSITAGTPTQSSGQTVTPITVTLTDGNTLSFNITSVNGTNGTSVTNVQLTDLGGSSYKLTTTLSDGLILET